MAAFSQNRVTLTGSGEPQELATIVVTANIFDVLGVAPMLGRGFASRRRSGRRGAHDGAVARGVAAAVRRRRRRDRPQVTINGEPVTIIGVMPRGFEIFGLPADVYMPYRNLPAAACRFAAAA